MNDPEILSTPHGDGLPLPVRHGVNWRALYGAASQSYRARQLSSKAPRRRGARGRLVRVRARPGSGPRCRFRSDDEVEVVQRLGSRLGSHYAMSVYPFLDGQSFPFGPHTDQDRRAELIGMVAALHASTETLAVRPPDQDPTIGARGDLEMMLHEPDRPWPAGPFSERSRSLIVPQVGKLRAAVAGFDRMVATRPRSVRVVTHGEPHAANTIRVGGRLMLIDWDTVGMADPERDLWLVAPDGDAEIARYTDATRNVLDPNLMMLYRLRFLLGDIARTVRIFRRPHGRTADTQHWWEGLRHLLDALDSWRDIDS